MLEQRFGLLFDPFPTAGARRVVHVAAHELPGWAVTTPTECPHFQTDSSGERDRPGATRNRLYRSIDRGTGGSTR
jgi:hypothetical protein